MSVLADINRAVTDYNNSVEHNVKRARDDKKLGDKLLRRWRDLRKQVGTVTTPTGLSLPQLALPQSDEPAEIARFLHGQGMPGEFPFVNGVYPAMYHSRGNAEEPTRLFAGLGLAEDTNARFHYLTKHQRSLRLSTAFDGPTLYGMDSDERGVFGKVG